MSAATNLFATLPARGAPFVLALGISPRTFTPQKSQADFRAFGKTHIANDFASGHGFSHAVKSFILVIPRRL
jgi:hypothetical protein